MAERVYAQCWKPFGQHRQICCEQMEITASDAALADLPSVVLPLAVADLPLIVWCRSPRLLAMAGILGHRGNGAEGGGGHAMQWRRRAGCARVA